MGDFALKNNRNFNGVVDSRMKLGGSWLDATNEGIRLAKYKGLEFLL